MELKKGSRGEDVKTLQRALHLLDDGIFGKLTDEAVREFQKENGLKVDGIVGEKTWSALFPDSVIIKKGNRVIKEIIVHCTATPEGKDYTVEDVRRWHVSPPNNWSDIGYHYLVYRDGSVHKGRDVNVSGAHCTGHNTYSIGVCYVGGVSSLSGTPKDTRTEEQKRAIVELLQDLRRLYPSAKIYGHRDFANKACPSYDAMSEYKGI